LKADPTFGPGTDISDVSPEAANQQSSLEAALEQSEQRYRSLFEESRDAIYITRPDGTFLDVNRSFMDMFGYTREDLQVLKARSLYADPEDRARFQAEIVATDCVRDFEVKLCTSDQRVLDCLINSAVHRAPDGEILWYQGIIHDVTQRKRAEQQLAHNAFHDSLTGLPNRALFMDRLDRSIRYAARHPDYMYAVLFLDIDRFKIVNDSLGHGVGDELLLGVGKRLESCLRQGDTVARLGGDEFAILLDDIKDGSDATRVVDRIDKEMSTPFLLQGQEFYSAASIGIALSASNYMSPEEVLRDADIAMYRAKNNGRGSYEIFDHEMHKQAVSQLALETDLRRAIERQEFVMHYQPIVSLSDGTLNGFEALVRWNHPRRGLLMPADFIPIAEETGLMLPMGWLIMRMACKQMKAWLDAYPDRPDLTMSTNLSTRQFSQPDLVEGIERILAETGCPARNLKLEITESTVMQNAASAADMLLRLRARGITLCIDDFGTGYSSLSYLNSFPVDTLKIDRSFITRIDDDGASVELIETIVGLSRILGMSAVAEGIETLEQLELVRRLGSEMAQGYFLSTPLDSDAAENLLRDDVSW
jgi:diguanylate cyclase (GGDEF)-like protein/PAS domain S-box-containing protein